MHLSTATEKVLKANSNSALNDMAKVEYPEVKYDGHFSEVSLKCNVQVISIS